MRSNTQRGYTLLFAVLTAALVLGVATFILGVSRKQHELAVAARNSIYSFYAADSGIECAVSAANWTLYGGSAFASTTGGTLYCATSAGAVSPVATPVIYPSNLLFGTVQNPIRQSSGYITLQFFNGTVTTLACAQITITTGSASASAIQPMTVIDSRGYNLCTETNPPLPNKVNTATVERALRVIQTGVW